MRQAEYLGSDIVLTNLESVYSNDYKMYMLGLTYHLWHLLLCAKCRLNTDDSPDAHFLIQQGKQMDNQVKYPPSTTKEEVKLWAKAAKQNPQSAPVLIKQLHK